MFRFIPIALAMVASAALLGCATSEKSLVEKGLKPLSGAELKSLYSRARTISWTNAQNISGTGEYKPDGSAQITRPAGSTSGTYRIVGDTLCPTLANVRGGVEYCMRVYKIGDNKYTTFLVNGEPNSTYSFTN